MSISALTELRIKVLRDLAAHPETNNVDDAIRTAWREFCQESEIWTEELDAIDAVEDQSTYTLSPTAGEVLKILWVKLDDSVVDKAGYYLAGTGTLTFEDDYVPAADSTDGIEVKIVCGPEIDATDVVAWVINRYGEGIAAGARAKLCKQPSKAWTNFDQELRELSSFRFSIGEAAMERNRQRTTRPQGLRGFSA